MLVVLLLCVAAGAQQWSAGAYDSQDRDVDFGDDYEDENDTTTETVARPTDDMRLRRYSDNSPARTLSDDEIQKLKGALKIMFTRNTGGTLTITAVTDRLLTVLEQVTRTPEFTGLTKTAIGPTRSSDPNPTKFYESFVEEIIDNARKQAADPTSTLAENTDDEDDESDSSGPTGDRTTVRSWMPGVLLRTGNTKKSVFWSPYELIGAERSGVENESNQTSGNKTTTTGMGLTTTTMTTGGATTTMTTEAPTTTEGTRRTRRKTTTTTTQKEIIDIDTLVEIIANLTLDYELINITDLFNRTLLAYNIPKCVGPTTTTLTTTTVVNDLINAPIISKVCQIHNDCSNRYNDIHISSLGAQCFVCGLETPQIPSNAYCADAFAGDFLPLTPVDPRAKGQIAKYRKYCRFLDVSGMMQNESQPRSVYGRWTGGCSVRWVDLSGVYTQRACRNRRRATMGKHFVSKRMAKLEMSLSKQDEGCIISPMSSLVPFSRGISLYARFHACVCTGNWCNMCATPPRLRRIPAATLLPFLAVVMLMLS